MKIIALTILLMIISCGKSEPEDLSWGYQKYGNRCYYTDSNDQCNDYTDQEREALRRQNINFDVHCTSLKKTGKKGYCTEFSYNGNAKGSEILGCNGQVLDMHSEETTAYPFCLKFSFKLSVSDWFKRQPRV